VFIELYMLSVMKKICLRFNFSP